MTFMNFFLLWCEAISFGGMILEPEWILILQELKKIGLWKIMLLLCDAVACPFFFLVRTSIIVLLPLCDFAAYRFFPL